MKQFNGYEDAKKTAQYSGAQKLPIGGYVCKILGVKSERFDENENKYVTSKSGEDVNRIVLQFDIVEGDYAGFFKNQYDNNQNEDKRYKGTIAINVPLDDGSEKDGWTKNSFARWTNAFEKSNTGYVWDWDEKKWKGKLVGITFGETGTVIGDKEVVYVEARGADSVDNIRSGNFYQPKFKAKKGYTGNGSAPTKKDNGFIDVPDGELEELPFN